VKQIQCKVCDTYFFPEDDETLCLACDLDQEKASKMEDAFYDSLDDGMMDHLDTDWSEY
jgi:hypothetical protein